MQKVLKHDGFSDLQLYPYQCHICHRAFPRNYSLKRHQLLHAGDKKYVCEICGYEFSHVHNRDRSVSCQWQELYDCTVHFLCYQIFVSKNKTNISSWLLFSWLLVHFIFLKLWIRSRLVMSMFKIGAGMLRLVDITCLKETNMKEPLHFSLTLT